jgi:MFS family permease
LAVVAQLKRLSNLEPGDLSKVGPIAGAYTLTLATIYVLKPARNALFLERVGVDQLPWVLMLVAVVGGLFVAVYGRLAAWIRTDRLVPTTFVVLAGSLLVFRPLLELQAHWVYFVFFVWVQVFGLVATSLVWLWASSAFDPRRARRVFGIIGSGGIAGAIVGGVFTGAFAGALGTPNLLFVASGLVVLALAALRFAPRARDGRGDEPDVGAKALRRGGDGVTRRLPRLLAINAAVIAFAAVFVDIQFNHVVDRHYDSAEAKAAFFGAFFAWVSGFSLVFQVAITPWLLRRHGVGPRRAAGRARAGVRGDASRAGVSGGHAAQSGRRELPALGPQGSQRALVPAHPRAREAPHQAVHRYHRRHRGHRSRRAGRGRPRSGSGALVRAADVLHGRTHRPEPAAGAPTAPGLRRRLPPSDRAATHRPVSSHRRPR